MMVPMTYLTSLAPKNVLKTKKLYFLFLHEMKCYDGLGDKNNLLIPHRFAHASSLRALEAVYCNCNSSLLQLCNFCFPYLLSVLKISSSLREKQMKNPSHVNPKTLKECYFETWSPSGWPVELDASSIIA